MSSSLLCSTIDKSERIFSEKLWESMVSQTISSDFHARNINEGLYFNPWLPMTPKGFSTFIKWKLSSRDEYTAEEKDYLPAVKQLSAEEINKNNNFVSWIGHASMLVKAEGTVMLFDPVFGEIPFVKKRRTPSALSYEEAAGLKGNIIVLLTHNHYDHFDERSIKSLPEGAAFIVPKGLGYKIKELRPAAEVREVNWWDEIKLDKSGVVFLPSQHWSKRTPFDTNRSLWGSYLLDTGKKKIFICGDTGYSRVYSEIASRYPSIDFAFMSVGASQPRWFMHYAHQDEAEAVRGFRELGAKKMIPIHWGSFSLGNEPAGYPALHLKKIYPESIILNGGDIIRL